jgi:hypothetical protein
MSTWIKSNLKITFLTLLGLLFLSCPATGKSSVDEATPENLEIRDETPKKETILDLIFGSEVKLPTERGILIIDAFEDTNKNGIQDATEPILTNQVSCTVDEINYSVPAFIPGLNYNSRYSVRCSSENYFLYSQPDNVFIERRGHVIEVSLPCGKI